MQVGISDVITFESWLPPIHESTAYRRLATGNLLLLLDFKRKIKASAICNHLALFYFHIEFDDLGNAQVVK